MTEETGPQVQLVYNEQEYIAPLAEVAPDLDPATAGDAEIIEAIAAYDWTRDEDEPALNLTVELLNRHQVTRPSTGHILCAEKAVFGE